ncbi:hypothetical protein AVEN_214810-1, partial [Araneus ventricosus]
LKEHRRLICCISPRHSSVLLLLDPRQPAYPSGCKTLTRTAGEGEPPQPPEDAEHPAPRQHLFLFKKVQNTYWV